MASRELLARRVRDALVASGRTQRELAAAVGMDPTALSKALAGQRGFKSLELALIADHLAVSTDALLAEEDIDERSSMAVAARFRPGAGDDPSAVVAEAVRRVEQMRDLHSLLTDLGYPSLPAVPPPTPTTRDPVAQGQVLADKVRLQIGLGDGDLPLGLEDFADWLAKTLSVDVAIAPLGVGIDGLALSQGDFRMALISSTVTVTRQRFTLAHELCHLLAADGQLTVDEDVFARAPEERRANAFAAAFLMPASALRAATAHQQLDEKLVAELLGRFRVSLDALAFRLHNIGVVDAAGRDRLRAISSARIALRPGRADDLQARDEHRAPSGLLARAMEAFAEGALGVRPLAALLETDPDRLLDELSPPRFTDSSTEAGESTYAL